MNYSIRHLTKYRYSAPVHEGVMEIFMQPRNDGNQFISQHVMSFELNIMPRARPISFVDYLGNTLHSFNNPAQHSILTITARATVNIIQLEPFPISMTPDAWQELEDLSLGGSYWDWLNPTPLTHPTDLMHSLLGKLNVSRQNDPLTVLRQITQGLYESLAYRPKTTQVDSPIDDALQSGGGVCQDFAHIMIAMAREIGIPCRYVSGYLAHRQEDRSAQGATHAWVEAFLPGLGWIGFDPTNNVLADDHHIRVGIGRDYADIPPTRGVFKGKADSELSVAVNVLPVEEGSFNADLLSTANWNSAEKDKDSEAPIPASYSELRKYYEREQQLQQHQEQQQQQQQQE